LYVPNSEQAGSAATSPRGLDSNLLDVLGRWFGEMQAHDYWAGRPGPTLYLGGEPRLLEDVLREAGIAGAAPTPRDIALFNQLVAIWQKMWDEAGRYGPAGLKIRRGLIVFFALIVVTFVLDVATAQAHLSDQQVADLTLVEGAVAVGATIARK
jgi:hypothetical protein